MLYIRTPNEPCAFSVCNHHPSELCIIKPYIFIELVIYSSSITQHAHTHTNTFFLSIFETPSHFAFTVSSLLVHQETDPQTTRVCWTWLRLDALASMWSLCWAALRLTANKSGKVPLSGVSEVSVDEKVTCRFGSSILFCFATAEPSSPIQDHRE